MKRKINFLIILVIFILILSYLLIWKSGLFFIKYIEIIPFNFICITDRQIENEVNLLGKNIIFTNFEQVQKNIVSSHPCLKTITFKKKLPQKIIIEVQPRQAIVQLVVVPFDQLNQLQDLEATPSSQAALLDWTYPDIQEQNNMFFIDEEGALFQQSQTINLPILYSADQSIIIKKQIDRTFSQTLATIVSKFQELEISAVKIKQIDQYLLINNSFKIALSLNRDINRQLASLQLILQKAKIDDRAMDIIDLRFDKPIVVYFSIKKKD